jgi:hypothetical protein
MAKPKRTTFPGNKIFATVKSVKGNCSWGHEAGDTFPISCHDTAGLCGFFYLMIIILILLCSSLAAVTLKSGVILML